MTGPVAPVLPVPPVLEVRGLSAAFTTADRTVRAVDGLTFSLAPGETLGIVGESGSGKSTTALALMGMLPAPGRITAGSVLLEGTELTAASPEELRAVRGNRIGMVFQDPLAALNPVLSVEQHLDEAMRAHGRGDRRSRRARAAELLDLVGIPDPARRLKDHPHQFSGGMRQRVMIALALANEPAVLLADEPTTALDATVQDQILRLLDRLNRETGTAVVLITHNLGVVARSCRRTMVMYGGRIVEDGPTAEVLAAPRHPYTAGLLSAVPRLDTPSGTRLHGIPGSPPDLALALPGCAFAARCPLAEDRCRTQAPPLLPGADGHRTACWSAGDARIGTGTPPVPAAAPAARLPQPGPEAPETLLDVRDLRKTFPGGGRIGRRSPVVALDGVSLSLRAGETLGIVGESGSGKSTLARTLVQVHPATSGSVRFRGREVGRARGEALRTLRREVQLVFQDPYSSLNPRMTVGDIVAEPLIAHGVGDRAERARRVAALLEQVGLDPAVAGRSPRAFSGGQRQRVGIARALAPEPSVLICDEPVSALDVSVQAQVVNLLMDLQRDLGLALLFIAHDLAVVRQVSHRIAVMHRGRVVETGDADRVCSAPEDPYTRTLLAAVPTLGAAPRPDVLAGAET
ncbi:dipeptide ABC transporter ATP-binding protein [Peterkaempfera bronchialis]|uniref:ABC transporter ATP-binding protein n=1 Tax=Peterkaempfera bronchialis TaxID=2126346 RepID=A0A345SRF9_9ACTN|nr:ABC transporter ATP-binding protein [Peterkaempfera bronchialis]AXI76314.1 ABC transporter ATP-binding protein [Peterkaempfera bronchialis]